VKRQLKRSLFPAVPDAAMSYSLLHSYNVCVKYQTWRYKSLDLDGKSQDFWFIYLWSLVRNGDKKKPAVAAGMFSGI